MTKKLVELIADENGRLLNSKTKKPVSKSIIPLGEPKLIKYYEKERHKAILETAYKRANAYILGLNRNYGIDYVGYYFTRSIYFLEIPKKSKR